MSNFEVTEPILNTPFAEPIAHWLIEEGKTPERKTGRRRAGYWYRDRPLAGNLPPLRPTP